MSFFSSTSMGESKKYANKVLVLGTAVNSCDI